MFHSLRKIISRLDAVDWILVSVLSVAMGVLVCLMADGCNRHARQTHPTPQNQNVSPGIVYV